LLWIISRFVLIVLGRQVLFGLYVCSSQDQNEWNLVFIILFCR